MESELHLSTILCALCIFTFAESKNWTILPDDQHSKHTASMVHLLNNLTNDELIQLVQFVQQRAYADLKHTIDLRRNHIYEPEDEEILLDKGTDKAAYDTELLTEALNLSETQCQIIEAYQNASVYHMIWALWNAQVEDILPEIDQHAILEYYEEKNSENTAKQGFFARLWNFIKGWFRSDNDDHQCYANEPGCLRAVIGGLNEEERKFLEAAVISDNLSQVTAFIENKLCTLPPLYEEYHRWNTRNDVPFALRDILLSLTYAQRRALDKLRRLELTNPIKDYYRGRIEQRTSDEQQEIEEFVQRMNRTFARCYNPRRVLKRRAVKSEKERRR